MYTYYYTVKETAACLVSQWYNEHLETLVNEICDAHKRDYPLTVLLPVVLEQGFLTFSRPFTPWPCEQSPFTPNQLFEGYCKCKMT